MGSDPSERRRRLLDRIPWAGAVAGGALTASGVWLVFSEALFAPAHGLASFALGAGVGLLLAAGAGALVFAVSRLLHRGIGLLAAAGAGAWVLAQLLDRAVGEPAPSVFAGVVLAGCGVGAFTELLARRLGRAAAVGLVLLGIAAGIASVSTLVRPPDPALLAEHAAEPGPYTVRRFHYGSGTDSRRAEYAAGVDRVTLGVDASGLLPGWSGFSGWLRTRWWGFDPARLPLNARVWAPEGTGPFPLVLVVHGNHPMERFSDAGYAYLGEHLAGRGFIVASVDENFLNRSHWADLLRPFESEMEARAGLLLEHLARWREWNATPGDPLQGRVDLERIALVGHSRGGEAVLLAAHRNQAPLLGAGGEPRFPHGFGIRAVVALAPVDGRVQADGAALALEDVSYLVLHGSHDVDLGSFEGALAFERVRFSGREAGFKAAVWIEGANHGQFNRDWGDTDLLRPLAFLLARERLLAPREQERATVVLVDAFLAATLRGERQFETIFRDPRSAVLGVRYRAEFQDAGFRVLADFEEDDDPETAGAPGARLEARGLTTWHEAPVERRWVGMPGPSRAVHLGWQREVGADPPHYALHLPPQAVPAEADPILSFSLADADYARILRGDPAPPAIELSIELEDAAGTPARLPLRRFGELDPLYDSPVLRPDFFDPRPEIVFRSFDLPLTPFTEAHPDFDPTQLRTLRFVFDETPAGLLALDDIGWRAPIEPTPDPRETEHRPEKRLPSAPDP